MIGLARVVRRLRWVAIAAWIVLVAASAPFASNDDDNLSAGFSGVEGSESQTVQNALDGGDFGVAGDPQIGAVIEPGPDATAQDTEDAVGRVQRAAQQTDSVTLTSDNLQQAQEQAQAGQPLIVPLRIDTSLGDSIGPTQDLADAVDAGTSRERVTVYVVGQSALQAEQVDESSGSADVASAVSVPVILILLLGAFGALVAALVPLALGFAAVIVTGMVIYFLSSAITISIFATSLSAMIGLAVAVDYSLFILMRYREELARGKEREAAIETAMGTSAIAVMFSGATVIVSLAGLFLMPNSTVRSMALGAIIVVAVALLGAATLLPALIDVLGRSVDHRARAGRALSALAQRLRPRATTAFWAGQAARVTRRPWLTIAAGLVVLLAVAYPVTKMSLNESTVLQLDADDQARVGTSLAAQIAGPGSSGPTAVLVGLDSGMVSGSANQQTLGQVQSTIQADGGVASVNGPQPSQDGREALYSVVLKADPESDRAKSTVKRLRNQLAASPATERAAIDVGGETASEVDFRDSISDSMWQIVVFILVVSFLILMTLLRSLVLPIVGVAMNVLCVGAAYGVLVAVFQWGWLPGLGFEDFGFVNSVILPLLLAVVFGLSMDYQVFLLTRVRERHLKGDSTADAARAAVAVTGPTIASAALIMVGVFLVFVIFGVPTIQAAGLGAAVAVAASALLVQLAFMPALIALLGDRVWALPRWLDSVLPRIELD
jgi:RND superfamily putative drug exporter